MKEGKNKLQLVGPRRFGAFEIILCTQTPYTIVPPPLFVLGHVRGHLTSAQASLKEKGGKIWVRNDHVLLEKNPLAFASAGKTRVAIVFRLLIAISNVIIR